MVLFDQEFPIIKVLSEAYWPILVILLVLLFTVAQITEEFGWRGFALDYLQHKYSALKSSLIVGCFWAIWHLPMFFTNGFGQYDNNLPFAQFFITLVVISVFITWIQNNTRNSLVPAFLMHSMVNVSGELLPLINKETGDFFAWNIANIIFIIILIPILIYWGPAKLSR